MVNTGPSGGCQTCKRKKVKCDEAKPSCQKCVHARINCAGYEKAVREIRFKDQTQSVEQRMQSSLHSQQREVRRQSIPSPVPEDEERHALCFFIHNFASAGRDFNSTRGFFECIAPTLAGVSAVSAVALSVAAVSTALYNIWRRVPNGELHLNLRGRALTKLRDALQDSDQSKTTETLLATLLLQFLENLSAVTGLKIAQGTHQNGALALVRHQGLQSFRVRTDIAKHLLLYIRHVEVSSAIRENRRAPDDLTSWCGIANMPGNPGSDLDSLGILVANTQHDFEQLVRLHRAHCMSTNSGCIHAHALGEVTNRVLAVEDSLIAWSATVPESWHPVRIMSTRETEPPVAMYGGTCEIYPSIQIASIWNGYRSYRLIILKLLLTAIKLFSGDLGFIQQRIIQSRMQALVDSIVYSVPFYLGNRTKPSATTEMTDENVEMPGYHSIIDFSGNMHVLENGVFMSREEHTRHAAAQ